MELEAFKQTSHHADLVEGHGVPLFYKTGVEEPHNIYIKGQDGRNLVKWLFSETIFKSSVFNSALIKTLLIKQNRKIFSDFCAGLQEVLDNIYYHAAENPDQYKEYFITDKNLQLQHIITGVLSILPFTEPETGFQIKVPQLIHGQWQQIEYTVERLKITSDEFGSPYFAYGLKPVNHNNIDGAQAQLLFMGTNPIPTSTGTHHTLMADTMFRHSVGEHLYLAGEKTIQRWINTMFHETKLPIIATGQSLGGSLAVIAHVYQPNKVQAMAFNPPGFLNSLNRTYKKKLAECKIEYKKYYQINKDLSNKDFLKIVLMEHDPITIFTQKNDPVFRVGNYLPTTAKIWSVSSNTGDTYNYINIHKNCYGVHSAKNGLKFTEKNPEEQNKSRMRALITGIWQSISIPLTALHGTLLLIKVSTYFICQAFMLPKQSPLKIKATLNNKTQDQHKKNSLERNNNAQNTNLLCSEEYIPTKNLRIDK